MKIDVEGAELDVLAGAQQMLMQAHPTIFLATHGEHVHRQCCDLLRDLGYQVSPLDRNDLDAAREILACKESQQI